MTYVDDDYARFIDAFDPQPVEADPWAGWRAVAVIAAVCAVALAVVGLGRTALDDVGIAGASPASADEFYDYCHSSPERKAWCEWQAYMADGRNRAWFAIEQHFPHNVEAARAVASCESNFEPTAYNRSSGASGVYQIVGKYHAAEFERVTGVPFYDGRFDPELNVRYAADLYRRAGWQPWVCRP